MISGWIIIIRPECVTNDRKIDNNTAQHHPVMWNNSWGKYKSLFSSDDCSVFMKLYCQGRRLRIYRKNWPVTVEDFISLGLWELQSLRFFLNSDNQNHKLILLLIISLQFDNYFLLVIPVCWCLMINNFIVFCLLSTICNSSSKSVSCNSELILSVFASTASQAILIVTDTGLAGAVSTEDRNKTFSFKRVNSKYFHRFSSQRTD